MAVYYVIDVYGLIWVERSLKLASSFISRVCFCEGIGIE